MYRINVISKVSHIERGIEAARRDVETDIIGAGLSYRDMRQKLVVKGQTVAVARCGHICNEAYYNTSAAPSNKVCKKCLRVKSAPETIRFTSGQPMQLEEKVVTELVKDLRKEFGY